MTRCSVDSYFETDSGDYEICNIYAVTEFTEKEYYNNNKLPNQHLLKELQRNSLQILKWAIESWLAGVERMKIAFVSRKSAKSNDQHIVNTVLDLTTKQALEFINFDIEKG